MYFIRMRIGCHDIGAARTSCLILMIVIALYATAFVGAVNHVQWMIVGIGAAATVTGMFLLFVIRGHFDASIISFPHLSERFELLTIITFGEGVVGMARFFDVHKPSPLPALIFTLMLLMFGCYMIQLHNLCGHHRVDRALRLMFTHYFIVIAINLMTIGLEMLPNDGVDRMFLAVLSTVSLAVFFGFIYANSVYYAPSVRFTMSDGVWCAPRSCWDAQWPYACGRRTSASYARCSYRSPPILRCYCANDGIRSLGMVPLRSRAPSLS